MNSTLFILIGLIVGVGVGYMLFVSARKKQLESDKNRILEEAKMQGENLKKDRILEAKEKYMQLRSEYEKETNKRTQELSNAENRLKQKEQSLDDKIRNLKQREDETVQKGQRLDAQIETYKKREVELSQMREQQLKQLETIAGLSQEEAKLGATREAKRIVLQTIQRTAAELAIYNTVTAFPLESDDVKGRIIGREGRNIKAFEAATGVEILIDDTPETIVLSCYDPIRREVARVSLERLIRDGRIHPARIEEVVEKTKKQIEEEVIEWGERTVVDLGITGLHPELIRYVGRMRFRSSYGQNLLKHSREVARLCATMAAEMGLNVKLAKRAGLLHDIGKCPDNDEETPHALLGLKLCEKYGEHPEVCNAVGAHHDEIEMTSLLSPVVQACDAISGSRPGARRGD